MREQALGRRTFLWIFGQCDLDEIVKDGRPFLFRFQRGRLVAGLAHYVQGAHRVQVVERRLQFGEFDRENAFGGAESKS